MSEIIRVKHTQYWTSISNKTLRDRELSLDTLGLLCRLLSYPNNWQVQVQHLRSELGVGQDKIRRLLAELETHGYLQRKKTRGPGGRWIWESTIWSESQNDPPYSELHPPL